MTNYADPLTPEEWERLRRHIADGPATTYLFSNTDGCCVVFAGGAMHPRCYLEIVEDDSPIESDGVDILKHLPSRSS